jgi:hypothetical protein
MLPPLPVHDYPALDCLRPNGLALSCAALIEREGSWAESFFQNSDDLQAACGVSSSALLGRNRA